jgi:hypothetical protein
MKPCRIEKSKATIYKTQDGKEFMDKEEAEKHDFILQNKELHELRTNNLAKKFMEILNHKIPYMDIKEHKRFLNAHNFVVEFYQDIIDNFECCAFDDYNEDELNELEKDFPKLVKQLAEKFINVTEATLITKALFIEIGKVLETDGC